MYVMVGDEPIDMEKYLEAILETLSDAIVVVFDRKFVVQRINPAGIAVLGAVTLGEVRTMDLPSLLRPEELAAIRKRYAATLLGRSNPAEPLIVSVVGLDGKRRILECGLARLLGPNGRRKGVLIRARDVTTRFELQRIAEERESLLSAIITSVPDALVVINEQGLITAFSAVAEELFGYREAEVLGRNVNMLMPEPHHAAHDGYIARYIKSRERRIIGSGRVMECLRRDGSVFPAELSVGEARSNGQRAFTGFIRDLTQRIETEARLHQTQSELAHASRLSAVGTLASALAHEINQPLGAIVNYLSGGRALLENEGPDSRRIVGEAMELAANEALRAGQIVHRLRDFVSKGETDLQFCPVITLIDEAIKLGLVGAKELGVECRVEVDPDVDNVFADRIQIQQVLINLIRNATEAMGASPIRRIDIRARLIRENMVEVAVADSGPGITPAMFDNLFKPFTTT